MTPTKRGTPEWRAAISAALKGNTNHKQRQQATCHPERKAKAFGLCTPCYRHQYYDKDRQKEIDRAHQWEVDHPDQALAHKRRWRETHPDYDAQYRRLRRPKLRALERKEKQMTIVEIARHINQVRRMQANLSSGDKAQPWLAAQLKDWLDKLDVALTEAEN